MSTLIGSIEVRVSSNNEFQILTNNYNNNSEILNVIQNDLGNSNNIPFNFNDMIQQTQQETPQSGGGGSETQQGGSGGGDTVMDSNTLHQTYINNITEVKESISKAREKIQEEYAKVYQEKQEALDALESDPESGVSSEIIQEIRNQTLTPKEFGETLKKVGEEYKWIEFLGEMVAEDFLAPPEDYEKIYTKLIEVGHNKATVQALKTEGWRHKSAIKDIIEKYYDPKSANAGQSKIIIKSFIEEGKVHGKTISKIMPEVYDPLSYLDNMTTVTEERFLGFKLDPKYVADKAKSGKFNALLKATGRELAVKNLAKNFGIWANIRSCIHKRLRSV